MPKRIKDIIKSQSGLTLVELIVTLVVLSIITTTATLVFLPIFRTFTYANNMAEVNTLLDTIAAFVTEDLVNANENAVEAGSTKTGGFSVFTLNNKNGIIYRLNGNDVLERNNIALLPEEYYRSYIANIDVNEPDDTGLITFTVFIEPRSNELAAQVQRDYAVRPPALQ